MYQNESNKLNEMEKLRKKMNYFKNYAMKDPFKESTFLFHMD